MRVIRVILVCIVTLWPLTLALTQTIPCPSSCSCSTIDPSSDGICRGCPTGSTLSEAVKVKCEAVGLSELPADVTSDVNWFDLSKNNLTVLSAEPLSRLSRLINLKLSQNNIQTISDGAFQSMMTLQILDLDLNNLTVLGKSTFAGAETLVHLDLSGNRLENVDNVFVGLKDLSRLDLRSNRLTQLTQSTFRGLASLRYLLLTSNRIYYIDKKAFRSLEKLVYIVLKGNPIGLQNPRFHFHSNLLTYVDVSECGYSHVPRGLPGSARYLQLRRNNLTSLTRLSFVECPYVTILVLDENRIESIEDGTFAQMTHLQQLWLNNNRLKTMPSPIPVSVERLLMDLNRIEHVGVGSFPESSKINTLSLMGNNVTHVTPGAFDQLERLKTLDLSNNRLSRIEGRTFVGLTQLKVVQLSSNPLETFEPRCFEGLSTAATLSLAYIPTDIRSIDDSTFRDVTHMSRLDLDSSPGLISAVVTSDRLLSTLGGLQELSMRSSDLTRLRPDLFRFLPNLTMLRLSSTRWNCDRSLIWLRDWMISTSVRLDDSDENRCATPRSLHGRSLLSLATDEFSPIVDPAPTAAPPQYPSTSSQLLSEVTPQSTSPDPTVRPPDLIPIEPLTSAASSETGYHLDDLDDIDTIYDQTSKLLPPPPQPAPGQGELEFDDLDNDTDASFPDDDFRFTDLDSGTRDIVPGSSLRPDQLLKVSETKTTSSGSRPAVSYSRSTLAIVVATVTTTLIIVVIILGVIIYLTSDRKKSRRSKSRPEVQPAATKNIPCKHKNGILYYTTSSNGKPDPGADPPDLITKTASGEVMTLIPGRDFNHEGPMRVYKWEDF